MRTASVARKTNETDIRLSLNLDGTGKSTVDSGVGFLDHMLTLLSRHGGLDLEVTCHGDTQVDDHHSVEDIGIALGDAFAQALGDKRGINRYASLHLPMDEALILCAIDISGRAATTTAWKFPRRRSAPLTLSWCTSLWKALQSTPALPSTCARSAAAIPTIS